MDPKLIYRGILHCLEENKPVALATVVNVSGSTPARIGAKMLIYEDGTTRGTVGGGCLEAAVIEEARHTIETKNPRCSDYKLNNDEAGGLGMVCGGAATVFIEPVYNAPELVIAGAGHISQQLARLAKMLNYTVVVIDDREEFASPENFPQADRLIVDDIGHALEEYPVAENTYIVIVTRGHRFDEAALEKVIGTEAAYIGMIGSRRKVKTVFDNLIQKGVSAQVLEKVHAPIGLQIGGDTPAEIALSIMAEITQIRYREGE